ncbi:MAG: cupin domain-containing protein [Hyphomonadaceae bacterium]
MTQTKVDLAQKFSLFSEPWQPKIVGEVNGMHVKLARLQGTFEWHSHEKEDEMFLVVEGVLIMKFRDRTERIEQGQFIIVPRGVEHLPSSEGDECKIMLFEPATTLNTGDGDASDRTVAELERI